MRAPSTPPPPLICREYDNSNLRCAVRRPLIRVSSRGWSNCFGPKTTRASRRGLGRDLPKNAQNEISHNGLRLCVNQPRAVALAARTMAPEKFSRNKFISRVNSFLRL
jgi:hypothetical protein